MPQARCFFHYSKRPRPGEKEAESANNLYSLRGDNLQRGDSLRHQQRDAVPDNYSGRGGPRETRTGCTRAVEPRFRCVPRRRRETKTVQLINKSKRSITLSLVDGSALDALKKHSVFFTPDREIMLKPKQSLPVEIWFKPKERLHPFTENILTRFSNGETKKLLSITGACHRVELKLVEEVVSFGNVIVGSNQSKRSSC